MNSLSDRLARLRQVGLAPKGAKRRPIPAVSVPPEPGWTCLKEGLWEREIEYPPILPERFTGGFVLPETVTSEDLVFYDLETTGLSGGAGNIAFLIGLGRQRFGKFVVTQLFLEDYPGETGLLERYTELIGDNLPQVSYNGRSFDSQVLKTRFLLNRMSPLTPPQVDLLYPSRRLWKSKLPNVRLGTIEKELLDFHRTDDLPGSEAPDAWFEWLDGDPGRIGGVFRHNADDIVSLARLLVLIEGWGAVTPIPGSSRVDIRSDGLGGLTPAAKGLAQQWAFRNLELERRWLEAGWVDGESLCGRELAVRLRREGDYHQAVEIWETLNGGGRDYHSAVELAKYREHRLKNPASALKVLDGLHQLPLNPRHRKDLEYRRRRLLRKMEVRGN
jgi:uncharacterized protein YprB with RNaseH-like and TPR domain